MTQSHYSFCQCESCRGLRSFSQPPAQLADYARPLSSMIDAQEMRFTNPDRLADGLAEALLAQGEGYRNYFMARLSAALCASEPDAPYSFWLGREAA